MKYFLIFLTIVFFLSCRTTFRLQRFRSITFIDSIIYNKYGVKERIRVWDEKFISLKNDSILRYGKLFGGLSGGTDIKYRKIEDELIIDSVNVNGYDIPGITNTCFIYNKDSLTNKKTNETYYNQKYFKTKR